MYALNTDEARKADSAGSQIRELGAYVGKFTQAEDIVSKNTGTKGIAFRFESVGGQKAQFSIYVQKSNGERLSGMNILMALMTCLKLRNIAPTPGKVSFYDYDQKKELTRDGSVFADLANKPIGVLLETEGYINSKGAEASRLVFKAPYQAETRLTASEILDRKTTPQMLDKLTASLRHRPAKKAPAAQNGGHEDFDGTFSSGPSDDDTPW